MTPPIAAIAIIVAFCGVAQAQELLLPGSDERDTYDKLGMSLTEWQWVKENHISMDKIHELMEAGVNISEYAKKPWVDLGVTEKTWLAKRRIGHTDEEIRVKKPGSSNEWAVVQNLLLPGYHEWKRKQFVRSSLMTGAAVASLALTGVAAYRNARHESSFSDPVPFIIILPIAMIWSAVDIHVQIQREINPEARRFSGVSGRGYGVSVSATLQP